MNLVSINISEDLRKALYAGSYEDAISLIETNGLQPNDYIGTHSPQLLLECVIRGLTYNKNTQSDHYKIVKYLLDKGADASIKVQKEDCPLILASYSENKKAYLSLILDYPMQNINVLDSRGNTALFNFIDDSYHKLASTSISLKKECLVIIDKFLQAGARPDIENKYGNSVLKIAYSPYLSEAEALKKRFFHFISPSHGKAN